MSVLVREMEMPKTPTAIIVFPDGKTHIFRFSIDEDEWTESIDVPTHHRRLIEEPELFHYGGLAKISPLDFNGIAKYFFDQIKAMPTIVEAEDSL